MKNILRLSLICCLFFFRYSAIAQGDCGACVVPLASEPGAVPTITLPSGIIVTSSYSGSVGIWTSTKNSCTDIITTPPNSVWLGGNYGAGAFEYKLIFSAPIKSIDIKITAMGELGDEDFKFTTNGGIPSITSSNSCFSSINGNKITGGAGAPGGDNGGGGGEFTISSISNFTELTIKGDGGQAGSVLCFCANSVSIDACPVDLTLVNGIDNLNNLAQPIAGHRHKQASNSIKATNLLLVGNNVFENGIVYHAGNYIELNEGFEAVVGSQFSAYIEGCTGNFQYRPRSTTINENNIHYNQFTAGQPFAIYPNPANNNVNIVMPNALFKSLTIIKVDGKQVYEINFGSTHKYQADISRLSRGIYLVTVTTNDGHQYTKKMIKN